MKVIAKEARGPEFTSQKPIIRWTQYPTSIISVLTEVERERKKKTTRKPNFVLWPSYVFHSSSASMCSLSQNMYTGYTQNIQNKTGIILAGKVNIFIPDLFLCVALRTVEGKAPYIITQFHTFSSTSECPASTHYHWAMTPCPWIIGFCCFESRFHISQAGNFFLFNSDFILNLSVCIYFSLFY